MTKFNKIFTKISTKIALTVSLLCILLFVTLNAIVVEQSREIFRSVIEAIKFEPVAGTKGYIIDRVSPYGVRLIPVPQYGYEAVTFSVNADGTIPANPLLTRYNAVLQSSILGVALFAIVLSIFIGLFAAKIFSKPLNELTSGMKKLRSNNYKITLNRTGTYEFDQVISEFNTLTKELQRVEDLRKDLISDTSHELKTPITSLLGQLEGIKDGVLTVDNERVDSLIFQVNRLNDLVEQLQEFSRIRNKNHNLNKEKINLNDLVNVIVKQNKSSLSKKKMKVNIDIDEGFGIEGNREMLERVFINLFNNAISYSKAKNIYISAKDNEIKFSDDGIGVEEEHLSYLFERFYRVEKSRSRKTGGLGLGLAIVKEIIEAHGWRIKVRNRDGGGLEFVVSI